jgi:ribonuclease HII
MKNTKCSHPTLKKTYFEENKYLEIGIDEAGRGPMFGRVYSAAVILPKNDTFQYELMKDSKKFSSKKKLLAAAEYIKENALYWHIGYETEEVIDKINIRNSTYSAMHRAIKGVVQKHKETVGNSEQFYLLVDGNDFKPYIYFDNNQMQSISHVCVTGGDNKYCAIAAASILAKVARDDYIAEMCEKDNTLVERYDLLNNKGYGTKKHMDGIKTYGITAHHRKTFGICKDYD